MSQRYATTRSYLSPDDIMEIATGFQKSRILLTAFELSLFTTLDNAALASAEVARRIKTDPRATDRLMNALVAIGLLRKEEVLFSNSPLAARFLVKGKPGYMGGLAHSVNLWQRWGTLTEAVRAGTAVVPTGVEAQGAEWCEAFIAAMHYRATWQAPGVVDLIDLKNVRHVLDVGGGSGAYAMAFCRVSDAVDATVIDLPAIIPITRRHIAEEKLTARISAVVGDYTKDPLGSGFDLIFLSAVLHSNAPDVNRGLLKRCAEALAPGGRVVLQEFVLDETRTNPPHAALFALNMLVGTKAGDAYTEDEVRGWMMEAGLTGIERQDTAVGTTLMIGRK